MENQFIFTNPLKFFEIEEKGKKRFFVKGDFSSTDLDLVNDICTENCLKSMVGQINSGNIKLDLEHEAFRGADNEEKEINKTRIPLAKTISAEKKGESAEATWEFNQNYKRFDSKGDVVMDFKEVKENVEGEFLHAFSIAYIPTDISHKDIDGKDVRLLNDVKLLNVALTGNPVNTAAQVKQIFTKSMDAMEEYKEEKKNNPDISNKLEVKTDNTRRNRARREVLEEEEDDEEEKTGYHGSKKKEKKTYEKDGAHAHTEDEPLGLHNHPEIEERVRFNDDMLNDRVNFLAERLFEMIDDGPALTEPEVLAIKEKLKSYSSLKGYSKLNKMEEKKIEKKDESAEEEGKEEGEEEKKDEEKPEEEAEEKNSEPLEEVKDLVKKQAEKIESLEKEVKSLSEVKSKELKANQKAIQENLDTNNVNKEVKNVGGLNELQ